MIDVSPAHLQTILDILKRHAPDCEVRAFGSRYKWTAKDYSDLDLAIMGERKRTLKEMAALREAFEESDLPYRVDVLDWQSISPEFQKAIGREYEVIQQKANLVVGAKQQWKSYKLDDLAVFYNSKRVPLNSRDREKRKGEYPYYGASGIFDFIDDYIFDGEFVLISEDGENLRSRTTPIAFKVNGKFWVNNHAHIVQGKEPFINDWIVYFFQNFDLNPYITGAVQPKLNKENLQLIDIPFPDADKAKKIVSILSALDEKIELNRQTNATLEAIAQSIFKEWFVDFNFPGATGEMVESALGLIPRGWQAGRLGDILSFRNGKSSPERNDDFDYPVYGANGIIGFAEKFNSGGKNIVIGRVGSFCGSVYYALQNAYVTENAIIAEPIQETASTFCFIVLQNLNLNNYKVGSGQPLINQTILSGIDIVIPSYQILKSFEELSLPHYISIFENNQESLTLTTLRDTLLPKLMNGEIAL